MRALNRSGRGRGEKALAHILDKDLTVDRVRSAQQGAIAAESKDLKEETANVTKGFAAGAEIVYDTVTVPEGGMVLKEMAKGAARKAVGKALAEAMAPAGITAGE
jgi:hypothetical protein